MERNKSIATKTKTEWGGLKAAHEEDTRRLLGRGILSVGIMSYQK